MLSDCSWWLWGLAPRFLQGIIDYKLADYVLTVAMSVFSSTSSHCVLMGLLPLGLVLHFCITASFAMCLCITGVSKVQS
jgi:hypothetical protein